MDARGAERRAISPRSRWIAGLAIAAGIAGTVILARTGSGRASHGEHEANERTTLALGSRAVVVSEAGTAIKWDIDADGRANVEQSSGNAFYRVERGGLFNVHTPAGDVRVLGTCFRVEVEEMKTSSAGLIGAGAGAALTATVLVTVYEGKVVTASPQGELVVAAGEAARIAPGRNAPQPVKQIVRRTPGSGGGEDGDAFIVKQTEEALRPLPEGLSTRELYDAHAKLAKEAQALRSEVQDLRTKLEKAGQKRDIKTYDIDPEELKQMADRCELRWDMPPLRAEAETVGPKDADKLHLSQDEREVIDKVLRANHAQLIKELRAIYTEITGDTSTGSLAPMSMFEEINDKMPEAETERVFQKLSRERAGLEPPPADLASRPAYERMYRLMSGAGDALEAALAKEIGPEAARAYRDLNNGFGARVRSSPGCPKGQGSGGE